MNDRICGCVTCPWFLGSMWQGMDLCAHRSRVVWKIHSQPGKKKKPGILEKRKKLKNNGFAKKVTGILRVDIPAGRSQGKSKVDALRPSPQKLGNRLRGTNCN